MLHRFGSGLTQLVILSQSTSFSLLSQSVRPVAHCATRNTWPILPSGDGIQAMTSKPKSFTNLGGGSSGNSVDGHQFHSPQAPLSALIFALILFGASSSSTDFQPKHSGYGFSSEIGFQSICYQSFKFFPRLALWIHCQFQQKYISTPCRIVSPRNVRHPPSILNGYALPRILDRRCTSSFTAPVTSSRRCSTCMVSRAC